MLAQYEPAFQDYRKAVELMPTSAVALNGRGKAHASLQRYHAAVRDYSRAIALNTKYDAAYENRGEAYLALGRDDEAAADFTQTLASKPDQPDVLLLRARAYAGDKKYNPAVDDLSKAIELKPDLADAYIERGEVYTQVRRLPDAIADLTRAIELNPQNAEAYAMQSLERYAQVRRDLPKAELLLGTGNLTELTDADTTGITAVLLGIASELHIRNVLLVQVSPHTRRTVEEHDLARRIMYAARADHDLPKDYASGLLALHSRKPFPQTPEEIAESAAEVRDKNFRIEIAEDGIHIYNRDGHHIAKDVFDLYPKLDIEKDGAHGGEAFRSDLLHPAPERC